MTFGSSYREVREIDRDFTWFDHIELLVLESNNLLIACRFETQRQKQHI